ncbi:DUF2062 domain-containing protein [Falsirhodobacter sp. 20TX0035]|uniref:DUF2062 domain-containing protein n=1 Tax=Falsirhodobacter sp. 20TX0035 TaxID=3022019 RepID=UPI0023306CD2|nr:DUF2062 domain-containing protein [Falsirhodobacter sp. 20TX0035]MDB6454588.1 DUF2062 domain-containing protein [Falsirhodobacter sp. 20TX0035]
MVFRRRNEQTFWEKVRRTIWPRSGWKRAGQYLWHRIVRLPDDPRRVARGVFAGIFACFGPYLFHDYVIAIGLAWVLRGNVFAALVASCVNNPLTLPFFAVMSVSLGQHILGVGEGLPSWQIVGFFAGALSDIGHNLWALVSDADMNWLGLKLFFQTIYLPYLLGGTLIGIPAGLAASAAVLSLVRAYRGLRTARLRARNEALRKNGGEGS